MTLNNIIWIHINYSFSHEQLDAAFREYKKDTWGSVAVAGFGGLLYLTFRYLKPGIEFQEI